MLCISIHADRQFMIKSIHVRTANNSFKAKMRFCRDELNLAVHELGFTHELSLCDMNCTYGALKMNKYYCKYPVFMLKLD